MNRKGTPALPFARAAKYNDLAMTSEGLRFVANFSMHPRDSATRMLYAKWLEERGERDKAEFQRAILANWPKYEATLVAALKLIESLDRACLLMSSMLPDCPEQIAAILEMRVPTPSA